jgi:hypothetical protein
MYKILISCFLLSSIINAQNLPKNYTFGNYLSKKTNTIENDFHTSIKPYNNRDLPNIIDSTFKDLNKERNGWIARKLFNEHFINIKSDDYQLIINPLINLNLGSDNNTEDLLYTNTRGIQFLGNIGKKFSFYTDFYENQGFFPKYINDYINQNDILPGEGMFKGFKDGEARDWAYVTGILNFRPSKFFDFQFGQGKNFIGDGYRSLLLSDNAFTYPFLKITTSVWKLKYVNLFTQMSDIRANNASGTFVKKYVTSHYLSLNIGQRLNVGLFESVIYEDSTGTRGYDINYLNPIIFYRPVEFAVGSGNGNVIMGMNLKFKLTNNAHLYGQVMIDEFKFDEIKAGNGWWANKFGFQLGGKIYDFLVPNLMIQSEVNVVRPYTYTHFDTFQNYAHYNQPLAHPLGANFIESVTHITYRKRRIFGELEVMYASQGRDTLNSNWGTDVYQDYKDREQEYGNEIGQGVNTKILYTDLKVGYLFNPKTNLRFQLGFTYRKFSPEIETDNLKENTTKYFYVGFSTSLTNRYHDF